MKKQTFLLCLLLFLFSCVTVPVYRLDFTLQEPTQSDTLSYSDDSIDVQFQVLNTQIAFDIQNKTNSGIKINWDELSFVSPEGTSSRVIHSGIKLIDRNAPQAPTVIPPNAKIHDILIPSENIFYSDSKFDGGWKETRLFPQDANLLDNSSCSVYFPLEIRGEKKEYTFKFNITVPGLKGGQKK